MSNTIYNVVVSIINEVTGIDPESISLDSHIVDDLQIDSFAATEILGRFEEEFNITINTTDFVGVYIISDIVDTLVELGATFDDSNTESYADTSDTAYLATENDIFSNGSKRVLTYKNMLDLMYDENKFFRATASINNTIAPYSTEKLVSYGTPQTSYSFDSLTFTINTNANNYKYFNAGTTHYISGGTMTITMFIKLQFSYHTAIASDDGDETNYNVSPASLDFDNEGTQTSSVEDTGVAYNDNTMANTPNLMSAGNNTRANVQVDTNADGCTLCFPDALNCYSGDGCDETCSIIPGVTTPCNINNCSTIHTDGSCTCSADPIPTLEPDTPVYISYKATVYPIGSDTEIATVTATSSVSSIYDQNIFYAKYINIPIKKYFNKTSTSNINPFGFRITLTASTDSNDRFNISTFANSTITYSCPTFYVFNPNDKTIRYSIANNLYKNYTQS